MTTLIVMACVTAATAASASAITIEPLNTKFEATGESVEWTYHGGSFSCANKAKIVGTTNSTKTNNVKVTPSMAGCILSIGANHYNVTYANECKVMGTVPWTLTLTSGTGPFTGTTTLNCGFSLAIEGGGCTVKASEQTIANHLAWTTLKATEPFKSQISFNSLEKIKYKGVGLVCGFFGFAGEGGSEELSLHMIFPEVNGIKAV